MKDLSKMTVRIGKEIVEIPFYKIASTLYSTSKKIIEDVEILEEAKELGLYVGEKESFDKNFEKFKDNILDLVNVNLYGGGSVGRI